VLDESEEEIEDIDVTDKYDPQQCWEYVEDIFQYLKMKEVPPLPSILLLMLITLFYTDKV